MFSISNALIFVMILTGVIWATGFFIYSAGNVIHVFLIISAIAFFMRVLRGKDLKD